MEPDDFSNVVGKISSLNFHQNKYFILKKILHFIFLILFFFSTLLWRGVGGEVFSQTIITGNIHNTTDSLPLPNAAIVNITSHHVTYTNLRGQFSIEAKMNDTIEVSHIGFETRSYVVSKETDFIRIFLPKYNYSLNEVDIIYKNYKKDSIEMRKEYEKVFNWSPLQLKDFIIVNPAGVGISIDAIYQAMRFRHNKWMKNFHATVMRDEQDRFIDYKFTPELVTNLTGLKEEELKLFMKEYRPSYYFLVEATDYEFYSYIKAAYREYIRK